MKQVMTVLVAMTLGASSGCGPKLASLPPETLAAELQPQEAAERLLTEGPVNFGQLSPTLYRGGQPTAEDLVWMRDLGVDTVINLRREDVRTRRSERKLAEALGMQVLEYPFYGVFGADDEFLAEILREATTSDNGTVYVHCKNGRDRTSLVVALWRVLYQGWKPDEAWNYEVLAYGHRPTAFYRKIGTTYRETIDELEDEPGIPDAPHASVAR